MPSGLHDDREESVNQLLGGSETVPSFISVKNSPAEIDLAFLAFSGLGQVRLQQCGNFS